MDESSTHVIERRLVHRERALRVSAVMFGYCGRTPRWIVPVCVLLLCYIVPTRRSCEEMVRTCFSNVPYVLGEIWSADQST